ncbi:MAG TPA: dihydrolipoyl dehydrogenase [Trueperaceae bacterium]
MAKGNGKRHDVVIVGAGPGGYVAAIRAAQLGFDVGIVEREATLGGTCVRVGCIPSKALLESSFNYHEARTGFVDHGIKAQVELDLAAMQARRAKVVKQNTDGVAYLMKKNGVTVYRGNGKLLGDRRVEVSGDEPVVLEAQHVVLATGSVVTDLKGVKVDGETVVTSTEALTFEKVPERLVVIGAGYIGLELGSVWARLGSQVTVLEYLDRILPGMDLEIAKEAQKALKRQGIEFRLSARVTGVEVTKSGAKVLVDGADPVEADKVLVAVGRKPSTEGLGLKEAGVELDERGRVKVDEGFATTAPGVYAIGDLIHGPMLAHKAEDDGVALMEQLKGIPTKVHYHLVPGVAYTEPEVATVGATEEQLKEEGTPYRKGVFPFSANGRARALGHTDGKVKILAHEQTDRILGVHAIGPRAGELIAEAVIAMTFGASSEDLARTTFAHPTLSEVVKEAALAVDGRALHS